MDFLMRKRSTKLGLKKSFVELFVEAEYIAKRTPMVEVDKLYFHCLKEKVRENTIFDVVQYGTHIAASDWWSVPALHFLERAIIFADHGVSELINLAQRHHSGTNLAD